MTRAALGGLLLLAVLSGCSGSDDGDPSADPSISGSPEPAAPCTEARAEAVERAQISRSKVEPSCVKLAKGSDFTLLNADAKDHSLSTTPDSPVQLQVDLRKDAAFPYKFTKVGTYTLTEASTALTLTIIVS